ncbi:protein-arginine N5-methyltransferase [Aureococcus anophagefferens]|nr:protein-arginine N5-methyltransferase [Aureococcus anophagefferens]
MHALAFLAVATTIVVGGGEDAAATVADGGACGNGRVIPDDRELELFHTVTDHGAWRGATFESTDEVLRFRGEVVMAADETVCVEALARVASRPRARVLEVGFGMGISAREILRAGAAQYVVLEPNRGVFDAALGLALETAASASPFLGFWEENAPLLRPGGALAFFLEGCGGAAPPTPETATRVRRLGPRAVAAPRRGLAPGELKEPVPMRVEEHVIVEANAAVLRALLASDLGARSGVKALLGFWQETVRSALSGLKCTSPVEKTLSVSPSVAELLVVAGDAFGYADEAARVYRIGRVSAGWAVDLATDGSAGTRLALASLDGWEPLEPRDGDAAAAAAFRRFPADFPSAPRVSELGLGG